MKHSTNVIALALALGVTPAMALESISANIAAAFIQQEQGVRT